MLSGEGSYSAVSTERLQSSSGSSLLLRIYKEMPCCSKNLHETWHMCMENDPNLCHLQTGEYILAAGSVALCCTLCFWRCAAGKLLQDGDRWR